MNTWLIIAVVLLAVLVGAVVPTLIQLSLTLSHTRRFLDRTGLRLDRTLHEVSEAASRVNRVGSGLEDSALKLQGLFEAAGEMGRSLDNLRKNVHTAAAVGSAVGPAIAAAIRALWSRDGAEADPAKEPAAEPSGESARPPETTRPNQEQEK